MKTYLIAVFVTLVSGCAVGPGSVPPSQLSAAIRTVSDARLCVEYQSPQTTPLGRQMIEAELGVRGIQQCGGRAIGTATATVVGQARYSRADVASTSSDLYNCADFGSGAVAQRFFLANGGPNRDPHRLDSDGDGLACEWGVQVTRMAAWRPAPIAPRTSYRPTCYTGPRGGTYTITASGNRNYSGC